MNTIKVSRKLLEDKEIAEIFSSKIGTQVYLYVAPCHLRSQFFNKAILRVVKRLEKKLPEATEGLQLAFRKYAYDDPAAREPWLEQSERVPAEYSSETAFDMERRFAVIVANKKRQEQRTDKFRELLYALQGVPRCEKAIEWTE